MNKVVPVILVGSLVLLGDVTPAILTVVILFLMVKSESSAPASEIKTLDPQVGLSICGLFYG